MAGRKANLQPTWAEFGKHIDLEPPVPFHKSLHLGAVQEDVVLQDGYIKEKQELQKNRRKNKKSKNSRRAIFPLFFVLTTAIWAFFFS